MNTKKFVIGALAIAVAILAGLYVGLQSQKVEDPRAGATPGSDFYQHAFFFEGLTTGGGIVATSTSGTAVPLLARDFDTESVIDVTLNIQDATLSFPATTTLGSFLPTAGDTRTIYVRNASTTAAMDLTITGGTGILLKKATTTAVIYGDTDGGNYAKINLTRKANRDIEALLQIFVD